MSKETKKALTKFAVAIFLAAIGAKTGKSGMNDYKSARTA